MQDYDPSSTTTATLIPLDTQIKNLTLLVDDVIKNIKDSQESNALETYHLLSDLKGRLLSISGKVKESENERRDMLALADVGQIVNSSLDLSAVLQIVMDTMIRLTEAERGFLMLRGANGEMETVMARNWEQESINPSEFAISKTIIERVATENQAVVTTNAQEDPRFGGQESIVAYSLRSILCVPMTVKGKVTGVIYADNRVRTGIFKDEDRNLLNAFANQAAIAIENARLFESVRQSLAEVSELKNLMDNVFASIVSGVITTDLNNNITLANDAAAHILGFQNAMVGNPIQEILAPIAADLAEFITQVQVEGQQILGQEFNFMIAERGAIDLSLNLSPLKDAAEATQGVAIVVDDLTERKRLEGQRKIFERMVSPAVIDQLDPNKLQLGGKRVELTTVFADIRGFTSFSERLAPEQLVAILNQYFSAAGNAILDQTGTIDKFMGDAIMAWFNAPIPQPDHCLRAVKASINLRTAIQQLHQLFPEDQRLSFGVGIHYGEAVLGLVGTESRLEYTAIGDSVNVAKRIQENSKPNQILISGDAYELVKDEIEVNFMESVDAKGKSAPIPVYELIGLR